MAKVTKNVFDNDIRKLPKYTTPVGELAFGFITEPSKEFVEDGQYFAKLKFPAEDKNIKKLIDLIDKEREAAYNTACESVGKKIKEADASYKMEEDKDGNETGFVVINFKRNATTKDKNGNKKDVRIPIFDSMGRPVDKDGLEVWGGSELVVSFRLVPFYTAGVGAGVSHRLEAIQLLKVVSGTSANAEEYGFEQHADGYAADGEESDAEEEVEVATKDEEADY